MTAPPLRPSGFGLGLRRTHCDEIFEHHPGVDFVELLTENYLGLGGRAARLADRAAATWPTVLHGTALCIGGPDPLSPAYLDALAALIDRVRPAWFSDHLCLSSAFGLEYHDLLPVPRTPAALDHLSRRIEQVQRRFPQLPFALENPSHYIEYGVNEIPEPVFLRRLCERTGLKLLLDINNIYVNAHNHGLFDPHDYLAQIPKDAVIQMHMAGHDDLGHVIIDTHGAPMIEPVLALYGEALRRFGPVPTLLEWDNDIPPLDTVLAELGRLRAVGEAVLGAAAWAPPAANAARDTPQRSAEVHPQSAEVRPQSAEVRPQSAEVRPQSAEVRPQSAEVRPQSAEVRPQSAEVSLQSGAGSPPEQAAALDRTLRVLHQALRGEAPIAQAAQALGVEAQRLQIYRNFIQQHRRTALEANFQLTQRALQAQLPGAWSWLREAFVCDAQPQHWTLDAAAEGFVAHLEQWAERPLPVTICPEPAVLSAPLCALAALEWRLYELRVDAQPIEAAQPLGLNPSLEVRALPAGTLALALDPEAIPVITRQAALLERTPAGAPKVAPQTAPATELVWLWRHPHNDRAYFRAPDDALRFAFKVAYEGLSAQRAAELSGQPVALVEAALAQASALGVLCAAPRVIPT